MAYVSDESGRPEIHVSSLLDRGAGRRITTEGGEEPLWSPDGREIFYRAGNRMMVVAVEAGESFSHAQPKHLFDWHEPNRDGRNFDVAADGRATCANVSP